MPLLRTIVFFIVSIAISNVVTAAPLTSATLDKLLDVSDLLSSIEYDSKNLETILEKSNSVATPGSNVSKIITQLTAPSTLTESVKDKIKKDISEEQAQKLITWFESPLGAQIVKAEALVVTATEIEKMRKLGEKLYLDELKVKQATKVMLTSQKLTALSAVQSSMLGASLVVTASIDDPDSPVNTDAIDKIVSDKVQSQAKLNIRQLQMITLYILKDMSTEQIEEYIETLSTPEMQALKTASIIGVSGAIQRTIKPLLEN